MLFIKPIGKETLERIAYIIGSASAAAQTLKAAETMEEPMFFETSTGDFVAIPRKTWDASSQQGS